MLFRAEKTHEIKEKNPDMPPTEQAKLTGKMWADLPLEEKKIYQDKAKEAFAIYNVSEELAIYKAWVKKNSSGPKKSKSSKKSLGGPKRSKSSKKSLGGPKRPKSSYMLFASAKRSEIKENNPDLKMTELAKIMGSSWKNLSDQEKQPYKDEALKLMEAYKVKKKEFEKNLKKRESTESQDESTPKKKKAKKEKKKKKEKEKRKHEENENEPTTKRIKSDIAQEIRDEILSILKNGSLETLSMKRVRNQLKEKFGKDSIDERKSMIKEFVLAEVTKMT